MITPPPNAPEWFQQWYAQFTILQNRSEPVRLPEYATASDLPSAADWRAGEVFLKSIDRVCVSNGTNWLRTDTGATV